jgi:hypothetical protein
MAVRKKEIITLVVGVSLTLIFCLGVVFYLSKEEVPSISVEETVSEATELFRNGKNDLAYEKIQGHETQLLKHDSGCELVVSILALKGEHEKLAEISKECLNHASGIGYDGLGYALSSLEKRAKAIELLEAERSKPKVHYRLEATLANLYMMDKNTEKARERFLSLVEIADPWSMWVSRILKLELSNEKIFLEKLLKILEGKSKRQEAVEETLKKRIEETRE